MCGIVGYVGTGDGVGMVLAGLERLEYRGYDSAGIARIVNGRIAVTRATGKLANLKQLLRDEPRSIRCAIGHTRWATHGKPSENNAHPHTAGRVSLIHNGIIENYGELKSELQREGRVFTSETDTEVAAHLVDRELRRGKAPLAALQAACALIRGSYAFLAIDEQHPDRILFAKQASPVIIGIGEGAMFLASDIPAVLSETRKVVILADGDSGELFADRFHIEQGGAPVERAVTTVTWDPVTAQKGGYKHFMLKEIHEQPRAISDTIRGRVHLDHEELVFEEIGLPREILQSVERVVFLGCGTAWHAGLIGKFLIERIAGIPAEVDYASEFRYRAGVHDRRTLAIAVSQSGETADTLAAIEAAKQMGMPTLAICNVLGSSLTRKVAATLFTHAGPEISVASTKAFTTQLVGLLLVALAVAEARGSGSQALRQELVRALVALPKAVEAGLGSIERVQDVARRFQHAQDVLYLGRGVCYPVALEGALKLKEISYIHAEGYPAGEMKHGPIALIDEQLPVVVILHRSDVLFEKTLSNLREVQARDGRLIVVTDAPVSDELRTLAEEVIEVPFVHELVAPILLTVPLQLFAYYVAVLNGTDVDLPRNLAKSVTVE